MKYLVTLTQGEDGWIVAECPALPGCVSQGRTREEALANIREAIELALETRRKRGKAPYQAWEGNHSRRFERRPGAWDAQQHLEASSTQEGGEVRSMFR